VQLGVAAADLKVRRPAREGAVQRRSGGTDKGGGDGVEQDGLHLERRVLLVRPLLRVVDVVCRLIIGDVGDRRLLSFSIFSLLNERISFFFSFLYRFQRRR